MYSWLVLPISYDERTARVSIFPAGGSEVHYKPRRDLWPGSGSHGNGPGAPKKSLTEHVQIQRQFLGTELQPTLDAGVAGTGHVLFVDAAHFVYGTFLCCLWSIARVFVRAASGRQRFNVLGTWNAVTRTLVSVTNSTVVNTDTMCQLLRAIAAQERVGPVTLVLDNARYQRNKVVQELAAELSIRLLFLPSYSPNLNLIERHSVYGRYHPDFASFRTAIETTLAGISTTHANALQSLMTLKFQTFQDVSLLTA
ncbi:transposase [Gemmata sp. JC717]|uniref:transposase n=1 Tax=Gemmata algarum TaxID=2975278 RepID=UPI0021BAD357|nr:transposase [Gemmata algarum]MDY3554891.1 transposase [Gemmata algarum]